MSEEPEVIDLPRAVWEGTFSLFGVTLHCAVLDNGQRVINADDVHAMFDAMGRGHVKADEDQMQIEAFARWQRGMDA